MTKPEYVEFCNQIHLLDFQANKGDGDWEATRKTKNFVVDLVGRKTTQSRFMAKNTHF